jgi:hypothetical protein
MAPSIEIDEEVLNVLKQNAEVFVDSPNTVLRRLLGLDSNGREHAAPPNRAERADEPGPSRGPRPRKSGKSGTESKHTRVARGSLLPESEYEMPILRYLDQQGGRAPSREVIEAVGDQLQREGRFEPADLEPLKSGEVRWKSRAAFVRLRLVETGDLDGQAPRGTWEITDQGRQRVQASN